MAAAIAGVEPSARVFVFKSARSLEVGFLRRHAVLRAWTTLGGCVSLNPCVYGAFESELLHSHPPARECQRNRSENAKNRQNSTRERQDGSIVGVMDGRRCGKSTTIAEKDRPWEALRRRTSRKMHEIGGYERLKAERRGTFQEDA